MRPGFKRSPVLFRVSAAIVAGIALAGCGQWFGSEREPRPMDDAGANTDSEQELRARLCGVTWMDVEGDNGYRFYDDGAVQYVGDVATWGGTWEILDAKSIVIDFEGVGGLGGSTEYDVLFDRGDLLLEESDGSIERFRVEPEPIDKQGDRPEDEFDRDQSSIDDRP